MALHQPQIRRQRHHRPVPLPRRHPQLPVRALGDVGLREPALELKPLLAALRAEIAKPEWTKLPENEFEPRSYQFADKDARLFRVHESFRGHGRVVTLLVKDKLLAEHRETFFLPPGGGAPVYLGTTLLLVGAGDFDRSGSSQLIFKMEGHNRDGYVMIDRTLKRVAQFYWSYK